MRVGTPEQDVRVTISTASPETLVVLSEYGCSTKVFESVPVGCASSRGMMFSPNTSSTWIDSGVFGINHDGVGLEANLDYTQAADFGMDTVGLGLVAGANGVTLKNQTVGGIASTSPLYLYDHLDIDNPDQTILIQTGGFSASAPNQLTTVHLVIPQRPPTSRL